MRYATSEIRLENQDGFFGMYFANQRVRRLGELSSDVIFSVLRRCIGIIRLGICCGVLGIELVLLLVVLNRLFEVVRMSTSGHDMRCQPACCRELAERTVEEVTNVARGLGLNDRRHRLCRVDFECLEKGEIGMGKVVWWKAWVKTITGDAGR